MINHTNSLLNQHRIGSFSERSKLEETIRIAHKKSSDNSGANFNVCQCKVNKLDFFAYSDQALAKTEAADIVTLVYTTKKGYVVPENAELEVIGDYQIPSKPATSIRSRKPQFDTDDSQTSQLLLSSYA
jgi:hypothetical protein